MPVTNDYKTWVARIEKKMDSIAPKLIGIICSDYQERPKSRPHWLFLKYHHGIKKIAPRNLDRKMILSTTQYTTLNYITKKMSKPGKKPKNI
jgi:galactose-1-phosphate uridylyltransferase